VEGVAVVGATLEAKVTPEKATVTYKWMRADAEDGEYVAIAGATDKTYTLSEADAGKWIKVEVKGTGNYTGTKSKVVGPVEEVEEPIETIEAIIDYNAVWNESRGTWYIKVTVPDENLDAGSVKSIHAITEAGVDLDEPRELTPDTDTVMWFGVAKGDGEVTLKRDGKYAYKVVRQDDSEYIFSFDYAANKVQGEINLVQAALQAVNDAGTTAAMQAAIEDNAAVLGLDMESYNELIEARQPSVSVDLVANKGEGYTLDSLKKTFNAIVATRHATQASMDKVNNATSVEDLDGISWVTDLLAQFEAADEVYDYHSGILLTEKINTLQVLVTRYEALPTANQEAALEAVLEGAPYARSQATTEALDAALTEQEDIIGQVGAALQAVNDAGTTAAMQAAIEDNAAVLGLDMESYNELIEARQPSVSVDLVDNKGEGYTLDSLKKTFNAIVATRHATQASMDKVNNATSVEDLDGISWVTDLLAQFEAADEVYDYHSGILLTEKINTLQVLVTRYEALPTANQEAALEAVLEGAPYARSQATTEALDAALTEQEDIIGQVGAALQAVNDAGTTAAMQAAIEDNAAVLGLDMESYNELIEARQPSVSVDLVANKGEGYTLDSLKKTFNAIVATRHATQASMDKVNNATSVEDLDGISWVTDLLAQFEAADEVYDYHSGILLTEKINTLQVLVTRYEALPTANQEAALEAVLEGAPYARSQATTEALDAALTEQEDIIGQVGAALQAVNDAGTTAAMQAAIEDNAAVLGLDMESYNELIEARQPSVSVDLVANKGEGYTLDSLKKTFNAIVATRHATQASMDKVNNATSVEDLDGISWVTDLLAQFEAADEVYDYHSGILLTEKINTLQVLVTRYEALPTANQEAALEAVLEGAPYARSQATTEALDAALTEQEDIIGQVGAALQAVNDAGTTAAMQAAIEDNAAVLGLDMESYNELIEARQPSVSVDLVANKGEGYTLDSLKKTFNAIVATRHATQASMDKVNNATSVEDLDGISWVTDLLAQFEAADEVYDYHSGILLTEKINTLQVLVTRYEALPTANQEAALEAVLEGAPYARSQATTEALDAALTEQEDIIGQVGAALQAVNDAGTTAAMQAAIEDNAAVLGLDMESYNELIEARQPSVSVDLVANKGEGYTLDSLKKTFNAIVATRHATQASMDKVNNATSVEDLDGISWVTDLLAQFEAADEVYDYHSGILLTEKINTLQVLVTRYEALPTANQEAALEAVLEGAPYARSQATTEALDAALTEQEDIIGQVGAALQAVNDAGTTAAMQAAIEDNAAVLGLDMESYNELIEARQPSVSVDLVANKGEGYTLDSLKKTFNAIVATRHATQASMDKVNNATSVEDLDGISWVTDLLAQFEAADEVYDYHSGILLTEKINTLQVLVTRYEALPTANQEAALEAVLEGAPYARSQATTEALDAALTEQEDIIGQVGAALQAVNDAGTTAAMQAAIEDNAAVLGLDMESYNELIEARQPSVSVDLVANKGEGYTLDSLKKTFNAIVATRHATQASMDKVNNATSVEDLDGISWVTDLLAQFEAADEVYDYHSGILLTEKINTLQVLVTRYEALPTANQEAALEAVLEGAPYARSQATTEALDAALTEQEDIIGQVGAALQAVNDAGTTAAMQAAIEDNAAVLGLDMESYNELIEARQPSVSVDLVANKGEGYTLDSLKKTFNAIVATRHATQASMDKVNNATSVEDLDGISWVTDLLAQFEAADEVYDYHSGILLTEKINTLQVLVTRYEALPTANQEAALEAVLEGAPYARSQATTEALDAALTEQEDIIGQVGAALQAVNDAGTTAAMQAAIEDNAAVLGLDMESYNELIEARQPSVSVDLVANKGEGYTLDSLKKTFNAIVATRHATQASMDKVNNATSVEDLDGISWVTDLLAQFEAADEVYDYHSGIALSEKIATLQGLVERYNSLDEAGQAAVLQKLLDKRPEDGYARSQATTDALAEALTEVEEEQDAIAQALAAVNDYLTPESYNYSGAPEALEEHLATLGLDVGEDSDYAALDKTATGGKNRKTAVFYDLNNNKPAEGYDLATLTTYFNDIVATRLVTQASMDKVNNAQTIEDLEGISFVTMLLDRFESVSYATHSGIPVEEKIATLQGLVERYNSLDEAGQAAVLQKLLDKRPEDGYARSQATTDALAEALTEVEEEQDAIAQALAAVNDYLTPESYNYSGAPEALEEHLATLGLDVGEDSDYAALDKTATGGKNRKTAVFYDLNNNKPAEGYDLATLTTYFNDIVATRLVTQASMDKVNNAQTIEDLEGISFVTMLLDRFESVSYATHSGIPVEEKIATLQGLVERYNSLDEAGQAAVLQKLLDKRPEDGYARSQATTDALAEALTEVEEEPVASTYKFSYEVPADVVAGQEVEVPVTFKTDVKGDIGYEGVRFKFTAQGPGDVTFKAVDSNEVEHTFTNEGYWGPDGGFDIPAEYTATTDWTLVFSEAGRYTITFSLIDTGSEKVIAGITDSVTIEIEEVTKYNIISNVLELTVEVQGE
jgi:type II secretory pathway predicted ATPase ExeA